MTLAEIKKFDLKKVQLEYITLDGIVMHEGKLYLSGNRVRVFSDDLRVLFMARCQYKTEEHRFISIKEVTECQE